MNSNKLFIRDVEEIREFVKLHQSNEERFDRAIRRLMKA
jgi:hypothetical protein